MKTALLLLLLAASVLGAEPFIEKQNLFTVGDDPAFNIYHIPGIVVTAKGTVLAWCEARKGGGDWSDIRILLRRSTDDGKQYDCASGRATMVPGRFDSSQAKQSQNDTQSGQKSAVRICPEDH